MSEALQSLTLEAAARSGAAASSAQSEHLEHQQDIALEASEVESEMAEVQVEVIEVATPELDSVERTKCSLNLWSQPSLSKNKTYIIQIWSPSD